MTDPIQQPPGAPSAPGAVPYPGAPAGYVPPSPPLWPQQVLQPPTATGPLTVGGIGGALAGAAAGFMLAWFLLSVGLEQNGNDFSDVDDGKFLSVAMLFAVMGAVVGAGTGLIIGAIVWSNRKGRFQTQYRLQQPWQAGFPAASQQYVPAPPPEPREY